MGKLTQAERQEGFLLDRIVIAKVIKAVHSYL